MTCLQDKVAEAAYKVLREQIAFAGNGHLLAIARRIGYTIAADVARELAEHKELYPVEKLIHDANHASVPGRDGPWTGC